MIQVLIMFGWAVFFVAVGAGFGVLWRGQWLDRERDAAADARLTRLALSVPRVTIPPPVAQPRHRRAIEGSRR